MRSPAHVDDSLGWEDPLEEGMATHSSICCSKSLWTLTAPHPTRLTVFIGAGICSLNSQPG